MPTYKTPDVYVEEISKLPSSVAQVETAIPAFIGGIFLAWLLKRKNSRKSTLKSRKLSSGALIGALAGVALTVLVLVPADFVGRTAHGGYGYDFWKSLPNYLFYASVIVVIATIAGMWTDRQLRKYLG